MPPSTLPSPPDSPLSPILSAPPPPLLLLPPSTGAELETEHLAEVPMLPNASLESTVVPTLSSSAALLSMTSTVVPESFSRKNARVDERHDTGGDGLTPNLDAEDEPPEGIISPISPEEEESRVPSVEEHVLGEQPGVLGVPVHRGDGAATAETPCASAGISDVTAESSPNEPVCTRCESLEAENEDLSRKVARLRLRLREAVETAQTHGQRLLRAAYQDKIRELTAEHMRKTTEMLNKQKKCFEDELEALDSEAQAAVAAMQRERDSERAARIAAEERFQKEREAALEKTTTTMVAVQRKMAQLHARATRLEREKKSLSSAVSEKQVMIEVLASAAAAKDVERRRLDLLSRTQEEERERKNALVESLQMEVAQLREKLTQERQVNLNLMAQIDEMEGERKDDEQRHAEDLDDCKQQSKKEVDRLGRLFASMMQEFASAQSDVSTAD